MTDPESESRPLSVPGAVPEPEVGIFWTWNGRIFHIESAPESKAVHTRVSIDYAVGHYAAWFIMEKRGILKQLPPHMRDEYDAIPRGRVVYLFEKQGYLVYHGDDFSDRLFEEICHRLHLPTERTYEAIDEHYNPLPEDFLF